jgi:hypothetical protein
MIRTATNDRDPMTVALQALAVTIRDERRAERLLALSGVSPADLRERAADPALLSAVLAFLEAHEPDLVAVANDLQIKPEELAAVRSRLEA